MAPGRKTGGRKAGTPNKLNRDMKAKLWSSFVELGDEAYLVKLGRKFPVAYASLLGRAFVTQEHSGLDGGPITYRVVTGVPRSPEGGGKT